MRINYYTFPPEMPIRACYDAWTEGDDDPEPFCENWTADELEAEWREHDTTVTRAKKMLRKYGGSACTCHIDRAGHCFEVTPIEAKKSNRGTAYGVKYNRHL